VDHLIAEEQNRNMRGIHDNRHHPVIIPNKLSQYIVEDVTYTTLNTYYLKCVVSFFENIDFESRLILQKGDVCSQCTRKFHFLPGVVVIDEAQVVLFLY